MTCFVQDSMQRQSMLLATSPGPAEWYMSCCVYFNVCVYVRMLYTYTLFLIAMLSLHISFLAVSILLRFTESLSPSSFLLLNLKV